MGVLSKISGPVIQAVGMAGSQINELVKVGSLELMGEIISLKGDRASIQVYEETSGLRPGEKVEGTGIPLSVELAPGLLGGVFDGIQRPLDKIRESSGDFIARGIAVDSIDRKKKWDFVPVAKKGEMVSQGDLLGTVKEFNIDHRILVPKGTSGKIEKIESGKFTVTQEIAVVGGKSVCMLQKWPVRRPREYNEKKHFEMPLVTGKRIVDTFFPIAKGGTSAIPGPFGSGKCVSGDTPVLLGDGSLVPIKQVFEKVKSFGNVVDVNAFEEIHRVNGSLSIFSFDGKCFVTKQPSIVYKGKSSRIIKVKTRTGKTVEVTPIHKLFVLEDDKIVEKPAGELRTGDYLATPRKINLPQTDAAINAVELFSDSNLLSGDETANKLFREALKVLLKQGVVEKKYANYLKKQRLPPIKLIHKIGRLSNRDFSVTRVKPKHGKEIPVPTMLNSQLAEFLGYVIADGNLHRQTYSVRFYNTSPQILMRYMQLCDLLFGVTPRIEPHPKSKGSFIVYVDSKAVFSFVNNLGVPFLSKAKTAIVPSIVMRSSDACAAAFISAYIACDGSVDVAGSRVEICSASREVLEALSFTLLRFGIISTIEKQKTDGTSRLWISGKGNLELLRSVSSIVGKKSLQLEKSIKQTEWSSVDAVLISKSLKEYLVDRRKTVGSLANNARIGVKTLQKLFSQESQKISPELEHFIMLCANVFFDEVKDLQVEDGNFDVYDLEVPETHNFVGGHGPLLLHNTVNQTDLAKYCDADIIVYVGAGERGNEMSEVLETFPKLIDPRTKRPLMERTVLIANTSNMPVAARESSIYTGITVAEYYRDMGYDVALMADSTSRWAEAMREISGRMEEMPGEEGYPAYLGKKLAEFYERAGRVWCLCSKGKRDGSVSVVGAVSPPGGDLSEPVSQATLRVTKVFWALDANLSRRRHYPAINWLRSYSLYGAELREWFEKNVAADFYDLRSKAMLLLQKEAELQNIVQLIGPDALPDKERLVLECTKMIREDFLQQNSFDDADVYTPPKKQYLMLKTILHFYDKANAALALEVPLPKILELKEREEIAKLKRVPPEEVESKCKELMHGIDRALSK